MSYKSNNNKPEKSESDEIKEIKEKQDIRRVLYDNILKAHARQCEADSKQEEIEESDRIMSLVSHYGDITGLYDNEDFEGEIIE